MPGLGEQLALHPKLVKRMSTFTTRFIFICMMCLVSFKFSAVLLVRRDDIQYCSQNHCDIRELLIPAEFTPCQKTYLSGTPLVRTSQSLSLVTQPG